MSCSVYMYTQAYCQTLTVNNPSRASVEATLRAGSSDRYTLSPSTLVLKPQQSIDVDVRLRVLKYAQKQKAVQLGQRDIFHIKVLRKDHQDAADYASVCRCTPLSA